MFWFFWGGFEKFGLGELTNGNVVNFHVLSGPCGLEYHPHCSKTLFWIVTIYFYNDLIEKMNKKFYAWKPLFLVVEPKVVLLCAYEMKEFMKMTSETLFTISTWYEAENDSNGSCNFVFNSGPQVCSGPSVQNMLWRYAFSPNLK